MKSYKNRLIFTLSMAAMVPILLFSYPVFNKVYSLSQQAAMNELTLSAQKYAQGVQTQLSQLAQEHTRLSRNQDLARATFSSIFAHRALKQMSTFANLYPVVGSVYLTDMDKETIEIEVGPYEYKDAELILNTIRPLIPNDPIIEGTVDMDVFRSQYLTRTQEFSDERLLSEFGIVLLTPIYEEPYRDQSHREQSGWLVTVVPIQSLKLKFDSTSPSYRYIDFERQGMSLFPFNQPQDNVKRLVVRSPVSLDPNDREIDFDIVIAEPDAVVFADVERLLTTLLFWLLIAIVLFASAAWLVAYFLVKPLRELRDLAQHYSEANHLPYTSRSDYTEVSEIEGLMAEQARRISAQIEALESTNDKLIKLDRDKDNFISNTSHELRTPLQGIIGSLETVSHSVPDYQRKDIGIAINSAKRLQYLVNLLLDYSQIKQGEVELNIESLDTRTLVYSVFEFCSGIASDKSIQLINEISEDADPVLADEYQLQQVIYQVIDNAIKFSTDQQINVSTESQDNKVIIAIKDHGVGIAEEKLENIFDLFNRDHADFTPNTGSGLGLAISYQLIEHLGGKLSIESIVNEGTSVYIELPKGNPDARQFSECFSENLSDIGFTAPVASPLTSAHSPSSSQDNRPTVLIVDDEGVNRHVLSAYFAQSDYQAITLSSGTETLNWLQENGKPALILLDIMMPDMTGIEVCDKLRERYDYKTLPIIFLSAKNQDKDIAEALSCGANDYLTKPIGRMELLARVRTMLNMMQFGE